MQDAAGEPNARHALRKDLHGTNRFALPGPKPNLTDKLLFLEEFDYWLRTPRESNDTSARLNWTGVRSLLHNLDASLITCCSLPPSNRLMAV